MKKKNWKRFLAGVLCASMLCSVLPSSAFALEANEDVVVENPGKETTSGGVLDSKDQPVQTDPPSEESKPSEESESPKESKLPEESKGAEESDSPEMSENPEESKIPETTMAPEESADPEETKDPDPTSSSATMEESASSAPTTTQELEDPTATPEPTEEDLPIEVMQSFVQENGWNIQLVNGMPKGTVTFYGVTADKDTIIFSFWVNFTYKNLGISDTNTYANLKESLVVGSTAGGGSCDKEHVVAAVDAVTTGAVAYKLASNTWPLVKEDGTCTVRIPEDVELVANSTLAGGFTRENVFQKIKNNNTSNKYEETGAMSLGMVAFSDSNCAGFADGPQIENGATPTEKAEIGNVSFTGYGEKDVAQVTLTNTGDAAAKFGTPTFSTPIYRVQANVSGIPPVAELNTITIPAGGSQSIAVAWEKAENFPVTGTINVPYEDDNGNKGTAHINYVINKSAAQLKATPDPVQFSKTGDINAQTIIYTNGGDKNPPAFVTNITIKEIGTPTSGFAIKNSASNMKANDTISVLDASGAGTTSGTLEVYADGSRREGTIQVSYTVGSDTTVCILTVKLEYSPKPVVSISATPTSFTYNTKNQKPTVTVKAGDTTLTENTHYTLTWKDASGTVISDPTTIINAAKYSVTVTPVAAYEDDYVWPTGNDLVKEFEITPLDISKDTIFNLVVGGAADTGNKTGSSIGDAITPGTAVAVTNALLPITGSSPITLVTGNTFTDGITGYWSKTSQYDSAFPEAVWNNNFQLSTTFPTYTTSEGTSAPAAPLGTKLFLSLAGSKNFTGVAYVELGILKEDTKILLEANADNAPDFKKNNDATYTGTYNGKAQTPTPKVVLASDGTTEVTEQTATLVPPGGAVVSGKTAGKDIGAQTASAAATNKYTKPDDVTFTINAFPLPASTLTVDVGGTKITASVAEDAEGPAVGTTLELKSIVKDTVTLFPQANDVVYTWEVKNSSGTWVTANGSPSDTDDGFTSYTVHTDDAGKTLRLKVSAGTTGNVTLEKTIVFGKIPDANFTGTVTVTWNGKAAPTETFSEDTSHTVTVRLYDSTVTIPSDDNYAVSATLPDSGATGDKNVASWSNLDPKKTYHVYVNGVDTTKQITDSNGARSATVALVSAEAGVDADGNGKVTVEDTTNSAAFSSATTAETAGAKAHIWVLSGDNVKWTPTPSTNYKFVNWEDDATTNPLTATNVTDAASHTATFAKKTANVTVKFWKNSATADNEYTLPANTTVALKQGGTEKYTGSLTSDGASITINKVAFDADAYDVFVGGVDSTVSVTLNDDASTVDGDDVEADVIFYGVTLATDPADQANGFVAFGATQPSTATETNDLTNYYLPGQTVTVAAKPATNYKMADTSWSASAAISDADLAINTDDTWKATYTTGAGAVTLTANFVLASHSQKVIVELDGTVTEGLNVAMNGGTPAVTDENGSVTFDGLTDENDYTFTVTDPAASNAKVLVGATATRAKADVKGDEVLPDITISLWSVTFNTDGEDTANKVAVTTDASTSVEADSATTKVVYFATGHSVTATATAGTVADGKYRFKEWTALTNVPGTPTATNAAQTFDMPAAKVVLTADFQKMYEVTREKAENGNYTATIASPSTSSYNNDNTASEAQWVDVGSYVTLTVGDPADGYRFTGWSVTEGELYNNTDLAEEHKATETEKADKTKTLYFKPAKTGATVNATFEKDEFTATVNLKDSANNPLTERQVVEIYKKTEGVIGDKVATTETPGTGEKALTFNSSFGSYSVDGLPSGEGATEYAVKVNGYLVDDKVIKEETPSVDITMYKITVKGIVANGTDTPTEVATSNANTTFTVQGVMGTAGASVYVPAGAAANSTVTLVASAQKNENGANNHYRVATGSNGDKPLWTLGDDEATTGISGTAYTITGIVADTELHAHFVQMHKVTATSVNGQQSASWVTKIAVGDGGLAVGFTASGFVDAGKRIKLDLEPATGKRLVGWSGADVKYYADGTTTIEMTATDGKYKGDANDLYVVPNQDVTVAATMANDTFKAIIKVKYKDTDVKDAKVEIKDGDGDVIATTVSSSSAEEIKWSDADNEYVYDGLTNGATYNVYVYDYDSGKTVTSTDNSDSTVQVDLVKASLAVSVDADATSAVNTANVHGATIYGGSQSSNANFVYVIKEKECTVTVQSTVGTGFRRNTAADTKNLWSTTATSGVTITDEAGTGTNFSSAVTVSSDADVTITASFTSQYTVKVVSGASGAGSVGIGDTSNTTTTVDHGTAATVKAAAKTSAGMKAYAFNNWTAAKTADTAQTATGAFGTGSGTANDATATYSPKENTTLTAHFRNLQATNADNEKNAENSVAWSNTDGVTWTVTAGYTPADHSAVITLGNVGDIDTKTLTASLSGTNAAAFTTPTVDAGAKITANGELQITVPINLMAHKTEDGNNPSTYTANLTIKEGDDKGDMSITIPLALKVTKSSTFTAVVYTYEDYESINYNPAQTKDAGIDSGKLMVKSTTTNSTGTVTRDSDGKYSVTGLNSSLTYHVWANGYDTGVEITDANFQAGNADTPFNVPLVTVRWSEKSYTEGTVTMTSTGDSAVTRESGPSTTADVKPLSLPAGSSVSLSNVVADANKHQAKWYKYGDGENDHTANNVSTYSVAVATILEPIYDKLYKIQIVDGKDDIGAGNALTGVTQENKIDNTTTNPYVVVGASTAKAVSVAISGSGASNYVFKEWKVTAATGGSTGTVPANTTSATFTPTENTIVAGETITLTPVFYKVAELKIGKGATANTTSVTYNRTTDTGDVTLGYTANSGTAIVKVQKQTDSGNWTDESITFTGEKYTISETTLKAMSNGTYQFKVIYKLGVADGPNANMSAETNTVTLTIEAEQKALTEANIQVKDSEATANVEKTDDNSNILEHKDHKAAEILDSDLEWQWYTFDRQVTDAERSAGNILSGMEAINGKTSANITLEAAQKGKYVLALVSVKSGAETAVAGGKVLTNAIPVDYDITVTVKEDESPITAETGYTVKAKNGATEISVLWDDAAKTFKTTNSALTGGVEYTIYVNAVEGDDNLVTSGKTVDGTTADKSTATVEYFTVNRVGFDVTHAKDNSGTPQEVGETFTNAPAIDTVTAAVTGAADGKVAVADKTAVLTGTQITATANTASMTQDYSLIWKTGTDSTTYTDVGSKQTLAGAGAAATTAYKAKSVTAKTYIKAAVDQNTYTIKGDVYATDSGKKGKIDTTDVPTLTYTKDSNTYTFNGTLTSGAHGAVVTFAGVPKTALTGGTLGDKLTLAATAALGSTLQGYAANKTDTAPATGGDQISVTGANDAAFRIFVVATTYKFDLTDGETSAHTATAGATFNETNKTWTAGSGTATADLTSAAWALDYAKKEITVTLTNNSNTSLKSVTLATPTITGTDTDGKVTVTSDGMADITADFDLEPNGTKTFKIAIDAGLDAGTYGVELSFSSKLDNDITDGPALKYDLDFQVDPAKITAVTIGLKNGFTAVAKDAVMEKKTLTVAPEVTYSDTDDVDYAWVVTEDKNDAPTAEEIAAATAASQTGTEYTIKEDDAGKYLWLVATGKHNLTGSATAGVGPDDTSLTPVEIPYSLDVRINQDGVQYTGADPSANYKVEVVAADGTTGTVTWNEDSNLFNVTGLLPSKTYTLKVSGVEGDTTHLVDFKTGIGTSDKDTTITVDYYSVTWETDVTVKNAYAGMSVTTDMLSEIATEHNKDITTVTADVTGTAALTTSGTHVVKGTKVTFTANGPDGKDYSQSWAEIGADSAKTALSSTDTTQEVTYSTVHGKVNSYLDQKVYEVKAYVKGGFANSLTMTNTVDAVSNAFTSASTGGIEAIDGNAVNTIGGGNSVTFQVPKGTYALTHTLPTTSTIAGSTGYNVPYDSTAAEGSMPATITIPVSAGTESNYGLYLNSSNYTLKVSDNIPTGKKTTTGDQTSSTDGAETNPNTTSSTHEVKITRDYGWTYDEANDLITLTLANDGNNSLKDVRIVSSDLDTAAATSKVFTVTSASFTTTTLGDKQIDLDYDAGTKTGANDSSIQIKINPEKDDVKLPAGDYTLTMVFNFATTTKGTALDDTKLTYKLILTVNQATLETVTVKDDSSTPVVTPTLTTTAVSEVLSYNDHTTDFEGVKAPTEELTYQWYRVPHGTDVDKDSVKASGAVISGATNATYTVADADEGYDLYLLLSAADDAVSVTGSALSDPVAVNYTGKVRITEDGNPVTSVTAAAPEYVVVFQSVETTPVEVPATWNNADDVFTASLKAGVEYKVLVNRVKGDITTDALIKQDTGLTVKSDNIAGKSNEATVPFFSVSYENVNADRTEHYKTNTGEAFDSGYPEVQAKIGNVSLNSTTPVLTGTEVTFTTKTAWSQDYDLTWQEKLGTATAYTDTETTQNATDATNTGLAGVAITQKTAVTAKLTQNTYTVTGSIKTGTGANISEVTMAGGPGTNIIYTTTAPTGSVSDAENFNTGVKASNSATITFTVPAGTYTVTATQATGTTITGMESPNGTAHTETDGAKNKITNFVVDGAETFAINISAAALSVTVTDDEATPNTATSTLTADNKQAKNAPTLDFSYTDDEKTAAGTKVTLSNSGNTALEVKVTVKKGTKAADGSYTWDSMLLYDSDSTANATLTDDKAEFAGFPLNNTTKTFTLADKDAATGTSLDIATITPKAALNNADDVVYLFEFNTTDAVTGDTGPTVSYIYDLTVDSLPLSKVTGEIKGSTAATAGVGDTVQLKGYDSTDATNKTGLDNVELTKDSATVTAKDAKVSDAASIGDIAFRWVKVAAGTTTPDVKLNDTKNGLTLGSGVTSLANTKDYTLTANDMGSDLYLYVYQAKADGNATGLVKYGPVKTQFLPKVQVNVDGNQVTGTTDPGYTLYLAEDSASDTTGLTALAWDSTTNAYRPGTAGSWTSIDPAKTYNVWAQNAKGTGTATQIKTDVQFKTGETYTDNTVTVDYYTVNFEKAIKVDNTNNDVTSAIKGSYTAGLAAAVGSVTLDDKAPVLKGEKVTFTMTANQANNETTSQNWSQDAHKAHYTAGWTGAGISDSSKYEYPTTGNTLTKEVTVSAADTVGTAAAPVTATLTQKLYTVKFTVVDEKGSETAANLTKAALSIGDTELAKAEGTFKHNDTITFTNVPAHDSYTLTATAGDSTKLVKYTVLNADTVVTDSVKTANVKVDGDIANATSKTYTITIAEKAYELEWQIENASNNWETAQEKSITGLLYNYSTETATGKNYDLRLVNTGNEKLTGVKVGTAAKTDSDNKTDAGTLATDFPVGGGALVATIYDKDGTKVKENQNLKDVNGIEIPAGGYAEIKDVAIHAGGVVTPATVGLHAMNFSATSAETGTAADKVVAFAASYEIEPATITKTAVTNLTAPVKGQTPNTSATLSDVLANSPLANTDTSGAAIQTTSVTWTKADGSSFTGSFGDGTSYKVTVVLTAATGYKFDDNYLTNYTILTKKNGDTIPGTSYTVTGTVTGTGAGNTLTLTYTFPATAAGDLTVQAKALSESQGQVTKLEVPTTVAQDFYYVVTTTETLTDEQKVNIAKDPAQITNVGSNSAKNVSVTGGMATVEPNDTISNLDSGTKYYVHAIAVNAGTATADITKDNLAYGSTWFKTHYAITVKVADDQTDRGNVLVGTDTNTYKTQTVYVPAEYIDYTDSTTKDAETLAINAQPIDTWLFDTWTISQTSSADDGILASSATTASNTFTPSHNATLTATFKAQPILEFNDGTGTHGLSGGSGSGEMKIRSNQITTGYAANLGVVTDGKLKNTGNGKLGGDVTYKVTTTKVTTPADMMSATEPTYFKVTFGSSVPSSSGLDLQPNAYVPVGVSPVQGLNNKGKLVKDDGTEEAVSADIVTVKGSDDDQIAEYTVRIWGYDPASVVDGAPTVYDYFDLTLGISSDASFSPNPLNPSNWDLNDYDNTYNLNNGTNNSVNPSKQVPDGSVEVDTNTYKYPGTAEEGKYSESNYADFITLIHFKGQGKDATIGSYTGSGASATGGLPLMTNGSSAEFSFAVKNDDVYTLTIKNDNTVTYLPSFVTGTAKEALNTLFDGTYIPKAGDAFTLRVRLHNDSGTTKEKNITLTFTDTTPSVDAATAALSTAAGGAQTVTTTVTLKANGGGGTGMANQPNYGDKELLVNWYTTTDKDNTIPGTTGVELIKGVDYNVTGATEADKKNETTLTVKPEYAGKYIFAVVTGDVTAYPDVIHGGTEGATVGHNYAGSATTTTPIFIASEVTAQAGKMTGGTFEEDPSYGTATPATGKVEESSTNKYIEFEAKPATGYVFVQWQIADGDKGHFGEDTDVTSTTAKVKFYPEGKPTIQAVFEKAPDLNVYATGTVPETGESYTYDYGKGASDAEKTAPEFKYDKNDGSGTIKVVIKPTTGSFKDGDWKTADGVIHTGVDTAFFTTGKWNPVTTSPTAADLLKANLNPGEYTVTVYDTTKGATATDGKADYDAQVTLTIKNTPKQLPPVKIADASNAEVTTAKVGDTVNAFFYDSTKPTDAAVDGEVSPASGTDNATYIWYYGPTNQDPTVSITNLKELKDDDGATVTDKSFTVTDKMIDQLRADPDNVLYVLATARTNTDYTGKSKDDTTYTNPSYTVKLVVANEDGTTDILHGKVKASDGALVTDTDTANKNFTVLRGGYVDIEAQVDVPADYQFAYWVINSSTDGTTTTYDGTFNAFGTAGSTANNTSKTAKFFPSKDATVTAVFRPIPKYAVTVDDLDDGTTNPKESENFDFLYVGATTTPTGKTVTIGNPQDAQTVKAEVTGDKNAFTVTFGGSFTETGTAMDKNGTATGAFTVTPKLPSGAKAGDTYTVTITVQGDQNKSSDPANTAIYTATYTVSAVGAKDIDKPTNGGSPDFTATVLDDPRFDIQKDGDNHDVTWKKVGDTDPMKDGDKFEPGDYTASVTIKFDDNTQFPAVDIIQNYAPTFNGETATTDGPVTVVRNGDGTITITRKYTVTANTPSPGPGGGGGVVVPEGCYPVYYWIGLSGQTSDPTIETVEEGKTPASVPTVTPLEGYRFLGWTDTDPAKLKQGEEPELVDPTKVKITEETTFYAVYSTGDHTLIEHTHYVIGFPDGTFGPDYDITRGSVATIIARACLDGFVEGTDYGNPGGYSDVTNHWAYSAISFCSMHGVFEGYDDGTFRPDKAISRQEFALVIARLAGLQSNKGTPFIDGSDVAPWAADGVYTVYANGWINGYEDGSFRPLRNISRAEAVKIFNGYLNRGVDAEGLSGLKEYVHTGVASNTGDGYDEYMTWPDVPKAHWAYYEIIEAANDHTFYFRDETTKKPPETWDSAKIDERWRYHDDANDGPQG